MRDAAGELDRLRVREHDAGTLGFHNDATATNTLERTTVRRRVARARAAPRDNGAAGTVEVWLDGVRVADLSGCRR